MKSIPEEYLDPTFGSSSFRRHIKMECSDTLVRGAVEDDCHAFSVEMQHDGKVVTAVSARWERYPTTTCPGSIEVIKQMVGCPLSDDLVEVKRFTPSLEQCTHIHDLCALMIIHSYRCLHGRVPASILYESQVTDPDPDTGIQSVTLSENGDEVLLWKMKDRTLIEPERFDGATPMRGFTVWAVRNLDKETLLRSFILQMACFVSTSRIINFKNMVGIQAQQAGHPANACYASREQRMPESFKVEHKRHFHDCPEQMLRFVDF